MCIDLLRDGRLRAVAEICLSSVDGVWSWSYTFSSIIA